MRHLEETGTAALLDKKPRRKAPISGIYAADAPNARIPSAPIAFASTCVCHCIFVAVHTTAPLALANAVVPEMIRLGWGRIINVTTRLGTMLNAGSPTYGPSKTALEALSAIMDPVPSRGREGPESPRPSCSPRGWRRSAIHPHCGPPGPLLNRPALQRQATDHIADCRTCRHRQGCRSASVYES